MDLSPETLREHATKYNRQSLKVRSAGTHNWKRYFNAFSGCGAKRFWRGARRAVVAKALKHCYAQRHSAFGMQGDAAHRFRQVPPVPRNAGVLHQRCQHRCRLDHCERCTDANARPNAKRHELHALMLGFTFGQKTVRVEFAGVFPEVLVPMDGEHRNDDQCRLRECDATKFGCFKIDPRHSWNRRIEPHRFLQDALGDSEFWNVIGYDVPPAGHG